MKNKIFLWSITVALAGFLFGFDTIVISGADKPIQELWETSPLFHGTFISIDESKVRIMTKSSLK